MNRKNNPRETRDVDPAHRDRSQSNWIVHLIDKGLESITTAGPVAWVSVVCIAALCAVVLIVYIMSGLPPRSH